VRGPTVVIWSLLADLVLVTHLTFILYVLAGGLLALRWKRALWIHLPAAIWGVLIELADWVCPLTPLENLLRRKAGGLGYERTFVEHYLVPIVYPEGLTRDLRLVLAGLVVAVNTLVYGLLLRRARDASKRT
jgi:hypothetical protein